MAIRFPWQRRGNSETIAQQQGSVAASSSHRRSPSLSRKSPSPTTVTKPRRSTDERADSAAFSDAAGSRTDMDEKTLCKLLLKQPAAEQLALDAELMSTFLHSCSIASAKPAPRSPSSVLMSRASSTRFSYSQYLRAVDDLSRYRETVASGIVIIGNGRSVLSTSAGGLVDNFGMVVRFNEYETESFADHVGSKTNLWVLSDWTCIKLINKYPKRVEPVLICIPYRFMGKPYYDERRAEVEAELTPEQLKRVTFVPAEVAKDLIEAYEFGDRWPSSGLITIWHFKHQHPELQLMLHGFDFFKEIDGKIHYMEDNCKANHHASQEERCCMDLRKAGRVGFLT